MKSKRSKALADKLVDDLLEDEKSVKAQKPKTNSPTSHKDDDVDLILDFDSNTKGSGAIIPETDEAYATQILSDEEPLPNIPDRTVKLNVKERSKVQPETIKEDSSPVFMKADEEEDRTVRLSDSKILDSHTKTEPTKAVPKKPKEPPREEIVKAGVGRFAPSRAPGPQISTEAALARSENLRIAQNRILELEQEVERLRVENEQLAAAGETLRRRADELVGRAENAEDRIESVRNMAEEEKQLLQESLEGKERQYQGVQGKIEELETRLSTNIQKIRVRERELENRLELVRMESAALIRSKDELILDLKRQMDQLNMELENYRSKGQELHKSINDKQEMLRRTVKALRLALSMLEGEDEAMKSQKKAK